MKKIYKKYIFVFLVVSGFLFQPLLSLAIDSETYSYLFHLYYDKGKLVKDRDFEFAYDLIAEPYVSPPEEIEGDVFSTAFYSAKGTLIGEYSFYIPDFGNYQGKISTTAPFFASATKTDFYAGNLSDSSKQLLFYLDLSGSAFCNEDNDCDRGNGEDYLNCPTDCQVSAEADGGGFLSGLFSLRNTLIIIIIVVGLFAVWAYRIIIRRKGLSETNPPMGVPPLQ